MNQDLLSNFLTKEAPGPILCCAKFKKHQELKLGNHKNLSAQLYSRLDEH
jgi:hypothetical protein